MYAELAKLFVLPVEVFVKVLKSEDVFSQIVVFLIGLVVGSFGNVCIARLPVGNGIIYTPSFCPYCKTRLAWWQLFPLFSQLILRKCYWCRRPISMRYFFVELWFGLFFWINYRVFGFSVKFVVATVLLFLLTVAFFTDLERQIIPDEINILGAAFFVLVAIVFISSGEVAFASGEEMIAGAIVAGAFFALIVTASGGGMGIGDVKLAALIGAALGIKSAFSAIFLSFLIGGVYAAVAMLVGAKRRKDFVPFGPFLVVAVILEVWGLNPLHWLKF